MAEALICFLEKRFFGFGAQSAKPSIVLKPQRLFSLIRASANSSSSLDTAVASRLPQLKHVQVLKLKQLTVLTLAEKDKQAHQRRCDTLIYLLEQENQEYDERERQACKEKKLAKVIFNLKNLKHMDFSSNNISGAIPYSLPLNVTSLNLADNKFSERVPYSIEKTKHLRHLNLSHNSYPYNHPLKNMLLHRCLQKSQQGNGLFGPVRRKKAFLLHRGKLERLF
ncbi:hypothetical protein ACS0TY_019705 [Phlomoides rotata]